MFSMTADLYDAIYAARGKDYAEEAQQLHQIIQQTRQTAGNTLLDVGCGTAVHLIHLADLYAATGLDLDQKLLDIAQERLPDLPFHQGDMADFEVGCQFDVIICLFSSIGYVKTVDRLNQTLQCFARHTHPGGVVVVEPWLSAETFRGGDLTKPRASFVDEPELKVARMTTSSINGLLAVLEFHYLISTREGVRYFNETHELGFFTHEEYLAAFTQAGFQVSHDPQGIAGRGLYIGRKS